MAQEKVTALPVKSAPKNSADDNKQSASATTDKEQSKPAVPKAETAKTNTKAKATKKPAAKKASAKKASAKKAPVKKAASAKAVKKATEKSVKNTAKTVNKTSKAASEGVVNILSGKQNPTMEKIMTQGKTQFDKLAKDATEFNREHVEACIQSTTIFAKGCEDMMRTMMSIAQNSAERQGKFMKEALSSKTLNEWTEVLNKNAQVSFDEYMSGATKLTELSVKMLSEAADPINNQMTKGMQKASKSMAA